jgi:hypothetical protein
MIRCAQSVCKRGAAPFPILADVSAGVVMCRYPVYTGYMPDIYSGGKRRKTPEYISGGNYGGLYSGGNYGGYAPKYPQAQCVCIHRRAASPSGRASGTTPKACIYIALASHSLY